MERKPAVREVTKAVCDRSTSTVGSESIGVGLLCGLTISKSEVKLSR